MIFEDMKTWNPKQHIYHGVVALKVKQVYSGAEKTLYGNVWFVMCLLSILENKIRRTANIHRYYVR